MNTFVRAEAVTLFSYLIMKMETYVSLYIQLLKQCMLFQTVCCWSDLTGSFSLSWRLLELDELMMASGQFTPLSDFDMNQYTALCTFFHQLTLSARLPLRKELTRNDVSTKNFFLLVTFVWWPQYMRELEKHREDASLMLGLQRLETDASFRAEIRDAVRARYC